MIGIRGGSPFDEPVNILKSSDPAVVAEKAAVTWEATGAKEGYFIVPVINGTVLVDFPDIAVRSSDDLETFPIKLLTLIYLSNTDGTPPSGSWAAYREFSGGRFYEPVVKRTVEDTLASAFGSDLDAFSDAAESLKGTAREFGDAAYSFSLFPRVPICFIIWRSDEEFPARASVLFDSNCHHHLSTFDLRMGAQEISGRLIGRRK
ncbi:MAG: DUF3786 domain-containing protein [Actinobacteria bacterium]|nr:DUF3786 domain-containing protein [Actinomycetota bacterium]